MITTETFSRLRQTAPESAGRSPRLVLEAHCPRCERVWDESTNAASVLHSVLAHVAATGHVVALSGTADLPEADDLPAGDSGSEPPCKSGTPGIQEIFYVDCPTPCSGDDRQNVATAVIP
jgi:hypothetical protein